MSESKSCVIRVIRKWQTSLSTISEFSIDNSDISGFILEEKGPSTTLSGLQRRVPAGNYNIDWHNSPRFGKRLPRISNNDVPKTRQILIHSGNYPSDTEGCLLPGTTKGKNLVNSSAAKTREIINHLLKCDLSSSTLIISEEFE